LDRALAISVAAASTLQDQVRLAQQGEQQLQRALGAARHDFASELDKLRADGKLAQERLKAAEARALLEIERERQSAARLQKDLDTVTRKAEQGVSRHREEVQKLQAQVGDLRQQLGVLEGNLMHCGPRTRVISMKRRRRVSSATNCHCHWRMRVAKKRAQPRFRQPTCKQTVGQSAHRREHQKPDLLDSIPQARRAIGVQL
jgi:hypothetical protein